MTHPTTCMHGFPFEDCLTCFTPEGECSFGGCTADSKLAFEWHGERVTRPVVTRAGRATTVERREHLVLERRRFCERHATHPHFAFVRRGAAPFVSIR